MKKKQLITVMVAIGMSATALNASEMPTSHMQGASGVVEHHLVEAQQAKFPMLLRLLFLRKGKDGTRRGRKGCRKSK
jgi:hypothetical protein